MANPSKDKGTRAESKVVSYFKEAGLDAVRKALTGSADKGDIQLDGYSLEVKTGKQTANPSRSQLEEWLRQSEVESANANEPCYLVVVRYRRSIKDAEVWHRDSGNVLHMQYLDDFVQSRKEEQ